MGWEVHPDAIIDALEMAHALAPELPLYIIENGSACEDVVTDRGTIEDHDRREYLCAHVEACRTAFVPGLPLRGLLRMVADRQLRVGVGVHPPLRSRPR